MHILDLPDDVFPLIYRHLNARGLTALGSTCTYFRHATADIPVHPTLTGRNGAIIQWLTCQNTAWRVPGLTIRHYSGNKGWDFLEFLQVMERCSVMYCHMPMHALRCLPDTLRSLNIHRLAVDTSVVFNARCLRFLKHLENVSIDFTPDWDTVIMCDLPSKVKYLHIGGAARSVAGLELPGGLERLAFHAREIVCFSQPLPRGVRCLSMRAYAVPQDLRVYVPDTLRYLDIAGASWVEGLEDLRHLESLNMTAVDLWARPDHVEHIPRVTLTATRFFVLVVPRPRYTYQGTGTITASVRGTPFDIRNTLKDRHRLQGVTHYEDQNEA